MPRDIRAIGLLAMSLGVLLVLLIGSDSDLLCMLVLAVLAMSLRQRFHTG